MLTDATLCRVQLLLLNMHGLPPVDTVAACVVARMPRPSSAPSVCGNTGPARCAGSLRMNPGKLMGDEAAGSGTGGSTAAREPRQVRSAVAAHKRGAAQC
jgi:hypothetical protein